MITRLLSGRWSLFVVLLFFTLTIKAQLTVNSSVTATQLISALAGQGLTVTNVNLNCPTGAYGTFSNGNTTNMGLSNGILLTTGSAANAIGPNNSSSAGTCNGTSGSDPQLTAIEPMATEDLCVLEFDIVPQCNQLTISFVFGSEEYPEFVSSSFNDAFGFFITGPSGTCSPGGYNNTNVATLPNNITPVSIDNVNATVNPAYYVNNTGGATIQYDGFTTVLTRNISVCPCATYHFKLAIADAGDCIYDSGVFVDFLSCNNALTLTPSSIPSTSCSGCNGSATVSTTGGVGPFTYSWAPGGYTTATVNNLCPGTYTVTVTDALSCSPTSTVAVTVTSTVSTLTITPTQTNILCNGQCTGSASVAVTGGTPPYTYSWAPSGGTGASATGRCAGNYTCTITDASGCTATQTFNITQPPALTATQTQTNVLCNGGLTGSASVTASGGTPGYTYSWAPSGGTGATATGLAAGNYTCTITDANGCTITRTFNITQPPALTATQSQTNVLCNGGTTGSASVTASGGTPGYTYSWSPSGGTGATATGLAAGNYTCTITDANGCVTTRTFNITQPPALAATQTQTNATCGNPNGSASVSASGGTPGYTYSWAPSGGTGATATGLAAGSYTCTITDANGCVITRTFTITNSSTLSSSITNSIMVSCNGGSNGSATVTASGGTGPYTYSWSPSGGTGATATGLSAGNYTVTVTDAQNCTSTATVAITQPPALTATTSQTNILCNGTSTGSASVTASGGTPGYTYSWAPSGGTGSTASSLAAGNYTCTITDANGCIITRTFNITQPSALSATSSNTPATCGNNNGSASITISGGTPGYSYSWAPSGGTGSTASSLAAGNYTCTVTDANNCTLTVTVNVPNTGGPTATISATNISCFGGNNGSAIVTVAGGTSPYAYSWSPSGGTGSTASALTAGSYTVTVTDASGCTTSATVTLTQPNALTATATSTAVLCNGGNTGTAAVTAGGGTPGYTYSWAPSGGTGATASSLTAGNYTITVTDANGCTVTATTSVTQPTAITATVTSTAVLCFSGNTGSAAVSAAGGTPGYTYSWAPSGGTGTTASSLTAGTYTVTITDANSCTITATTTVTEPPQLTVAVTTIPATCGNSTGSASASPSGGNGSYTYLWTPGNNTTSSISNLNAGNYQVTVTDGNGCTATAIATVNNSNSPVASILASDSVSCFGGNDGSAAAGASSGTGPYTYLWSNNDADSLAGNLTAGSYTVTVTDANGCSDTASVTIFEPTQLTATTTQVDVLCFGNTTGSATVSAAGGTPVYSYSWTSGGTAATENNLAAGSYTCTITDANGCTTTASVTITEPPQLTATTTQVDELCFGGTNGSATVTPAGGSPVYTYLWTSGGTAATESNLAAGSYTCTITDANGCTTTASVTLTEPTAVVASATAVDAHCNQSDGSATGSATGGTGTYTYTWLPSGSGATLSNIPAGSYSVIATDANGCADTAAIQVLNINGVNTTLVSSSDITCFGGNDGDITISATGGSPAYTYTWSPNVSTTTSASSLTAGTYQITVTDQTGCTSTITVTLTEPPALTITAAANPAAVCEGTPVSLSSTPSGGTPAYTITWNPGALAGQNQTLIPAATTTYTVDVTDANGCSANATVLVTVNAMPSAALTADVTEGCAPLCVNFLDSSLLASGTITSWQWNFGDNSTSTSQNPSHCYSTPGTYDVSLTVTTAAGCTGTINMTGYINVYTNPVAGFSATPQPTTILNSTVYFTDTSSSATSWNWSFGDVANSTSTVQNPNFTYPDPTCYSVVLTVSSADGCVDTATQIICIDPDVSIYVPNTFTPNEDGTNDVFYPVTIGIDPDKYELWIFDRWGNMIFYTDDLNDGWDGRVQGSADICQIDTYVWKIKAIDVLGKKHNLIGHVNLIK